MHHICGRGVQHQNISFRPEPACLCCTVDVTQQGRLKDHQRPRDGAFFARSMSSSSLCGRRDSHYPLFWILAPEPEAPPARAHRLLRHRHVARGGRHRPRGDHRLARAADPRPVPSEPRGQPEHVRRVRRLLPRASAQEGVRRRGDRHRLARRRRRGAGQILHGAAAGPRRGDQPHEPRHHDPTDDGQRHHRQHGRGDRGEALRGGGRHHRQRGAGVHHGGRAARPGRE
mmetsp:Transcript_26689/g.70074  ORF Transcript_26689/g.70074 Transcript_26689/m.70074 type:complete len:229 (-) Transcript_26689:264-950(-)